METKQFEQTAPEQEMTAPAAPKKEKKQKRPKMGRRIRTLTPMNLIMPFIMKDRSDALNYVSDSIDITNAEKYIAEKKKQGYTNFTIMHLFLAAYVRAVAEKPGINRYVRGQRI